MEVYFDNSATTRVLDEVKDLTVKLMTEDYGNPSARHRKGMEAEQYVKNASFPDRKNPEGKGKGNPLYLRRYGVQQYGSDRHSPCQPEGGKTHHQYTDRACFRVSAPGIF